MNVIIFGATGMIGQGVLRECLLDRRVDHVLTIGRRPTGRVHPKLREIAHDNLLDFSALIHELGGYDACFFCLGVSSAGLGEQQYRHVTVEMPLAAARALVARYPAMTFIYVSGAGADGTAAGRVMWARVKGEAENALRQLPFRAVYAFRPAFVQPMHGITSRTRLYRVLYRIAGPLYPLWKAIAPSYVTTTEQIGRAMINVAANGAPTHVLENADINRA